MKITYEKTAHSEYYIIGDLFTLIITNSKGIIPIVKHKGDTDKTLKAIDIGHDIITTVTEGGDFEKVKSRLWEVYHLKITT